MSRSRNFHARQTLDKLYDTLVEPWIRGRAGAGTHLAKLSYLLQAIHRSLAKMVPLARSNASPPQRLGLTSPISFQVGDIYRDTTSPAYQASDEAAAGVYEKWNSYRQVTMIALGSSIGMGIAHSEAASPSQAAVRPYDPVLCCSLRNVLPFPSYSGGTLTTAIHSYREIRRSRGSLRPRLVNIGAASEYGEIEVVCLSIKFVWIFVVIMSMNVLSAGGGNYPAVGFRYWREAPFTNGFKGYLSMMPTCIFAMAGSENCGLVAAETANSKKSAPRPVGPIRLRLAPSHPPGSLMVTISLSPYYPDLFGGDGTNPLPFVIAYRDGGAHPLAHIMNVVILTLVISTGPISGYGGSRTTMGLAAIGMAPRRFLMGDRTGRPWYGLVQTFILGGSLTYLNASNSGVEVFCWFSNLTSLFTLFGWGMICLSHVRMRTAWARQGRTVEELLWKSWLGMQVPIRRLVRPDLCIMLVVVQFYLAVLALDASPSAEGFFANYGFVILTIVLWVGARVYYRGNRWVDANTVDLDNGHRF
ncbi:hypothetical protein DL767_001159 [Monosporascus sp. MG133]|nr:hypothetical protein DL767_001159 [Monosporascus sp. MG133]